MADNSGRNCLAGNMSSSVTLECKKLCFLRCFSAVALSLLTQFLLLAVFLLFVNFHILHLVHWITATFGLMFSFYTWLSIMPLLGAVLIYGILLGKSHLAAKKYYGSRFRWLVGTFANKLLFLLIHILVGLLTAWLYTRFLHVDYRHMIFECYGMDCINSRYTFILCAGITASCYHFVRENLRQEPEVEFPIMQQLKLVQIRSLLFTTLYNSLLMSFVPTLVFGFVYWLLGGLLNRRFASIFDVDVDESLESLLSIFGNLRLLFYTWILCSQILSNMHLMQRFFSIFLAEELNFTIEKSRVMQLANSGVPLVEALAVTHFPVLQNLAALELYNISHNKNAAKRQEIFTLSVPGGHPYNWNQLSAQCLGLISIFTDELSASFKNISTVKCTPLFATVKLNSATEAAEKILLRQYNETYGIRRMVRDPISTVSPTSGCPTKTSTKKTTTACQRINEHFEHMSRQIEQVFRTVFRTIPGLYYMFGEPDGAKTAFLLSNSQSIVWLTQGLAGVCAASLVEDKYGVVQAALPQVIKALLRLKLELDKLNNVNLNGKKLDRNLISLKNAVKRGLYNLCSVFGDYLREFIDEPEDLRNLQVFVNYQET